MGRYNYAAVVPFRLNIGEQPLHEDLGTMIDGYDGDRGWQNAGEAADAPVTKGDELCGFGFEKDGQIVVLINEHQYSDCGSQDNSFVAATKEALEQFKRDFGFEGEVEEDVIVKQTV